jgi:flagellar biosynthesis/type III secretory pathway chaperone
MPPGASRSGAEIAQTSSGDATSDLLAVLEAQRTTYAHLLELARERTAALRAADVGRLTELAEAEEPLLSRTRRLESARIQLVRPWAEQLAVPAEQVSVSVLTPVLTPHDAAALTTARDALLETVGALDAVNQENARLLNACLESVGDSVNHLLQSVQTDPRYAQSGGRSANESGPRLTDLRA